jgi:hypothetical protein
MPDSDPDLLDSLIGRAQESAADRLDRQMRESPEIKAREEADSQDRLEKMWMQEHERQRAIARQQAEQRRQEQMLVRYVLVGAAIFLLIIIVVALLLALSGGETAPQGQLLLLNTYA